MTALSSERPSGVWSVERSLYPLEQVRREERGPGVLPPHSPRLPDLSLSLTAFSWWGVGRSRYRLTEWEGATGPAAPRQ